MWTLFACSDFALVHEKVIPGETATTDTGSIDTDTDTLVDTDDTAADTNIEDTDTTPTDTSPAVCSRVLVYSTEGQTGGGRYLAFFDGLSTDAALAGFEIEVLEQAIDGPLTEAMLQDRTQLWILGTWREEGTTFELSQVSAVRDFVEAGNGLLLAAEHSDSLYNYTDDVNLLAQLWGVTFSGSVNEGADGAILTPGRATGPLVTGVSQLPGFASTAGLTIDDPAVEVAFTLAGNDAVAWRDDDARVVFDRSWGGWRDLFRSSGDQATYVANVANFLEPCP